MWRWKLWLIATNERALQHLGRPISSIKIVDIFVLYQSPEVFCIRISKFKTVGGDAMKPQGAGKFQDIQDQGPI